jgi:uncharacterized membrane protein (DUF485 family)
VPLQKVDRMQRFVSAMALAMLVLFAGLSSITAYSYWVNRNRMTLADILNRPMCGSGLTPRQAAMRR